MAGGRLTSVNRPRFRSIERASASTPYISHRIKRIKDIVMKILTNAAIAATTISVIAFASLAVDAVLAHTDQINLPKQQAPELKNSNVVTRYSEWKYQALYERVKKRAVLEEISEFLSPLKLKQKLIFETTTCGVENAFYD